MSSGGSQGLVIDLVEHCEDFSGHVALEAADDLLLGLALGGAPGEVVAGGLVPAQPHDHDPVERGVGLAVAAAVEPIPAGLAGGGLDGGAAAQRGERGFAAEPAGVVTGGDQQLGFTVAAAPEQGAQLGAVLAVSWSSLPVSRPISASR